MGERTDPAELACLCTNLRMASRAITRRYDRALAPFAIRTTQFSILRRLMLDGPDTVSHLAARLVLDRTSLGRELQTLARDGLVELEIGEDRRERRAAITPAGAARARAAQPVWLELQESLEHELGAERLPAIVGELRELAARG